ncbi:MAG: magnesium/cobalt transporter CorA [Chlorobiota bacterium]|nr:magnesium/cobalt transporter CorA [Chlorobiota bacterium]QQS67191.1 MAG: magnesium/cobalt transporter CorA [Chlorobiota bacterium]
MIKGITIGSDSQIKDLGFIDLQNYIIEIYKEIEAGIEPTTLWIDIYKPTIEEESILENIFHFHPLTIEDCKNESYNIRGGEHLPKLEDYDDYLFIIINQIQLNRNTQTNKFELQTNQLNAFILDHIIITHHLNSSSAILKAHEACIKNPKIFHHGPDFLYQLILDEAVDEIQPILNKFDNVIEKLEDEIFKTPTQLILANILSLKRDLFKIRRVITYQREITYRLSRGDYKLITEKESIFYRNVYDHLVRATEITESYRDTLSSLLEAYLSTASNKMNEVMKVLTIISTFFLPLTFIVGLYGMNFKFMPELEWHYGYVMCLGLMLVTSTFMFLFFRRKGWL